MKTMKQEMIEEKRRYRAVTVPGGDKLCGVLTLPQTSVVSAVLFSHGWSGVRCGPNGLLKRMADRLSEKGVASLRFDYAGRGESEGDGLAVSLRSQAEDLQRAAAFLRMETGIENICICGLCSGGNVAIGVLNKLRPVDRVALFSVYPFSDGDSFSRDAGRMVHYLKIYWHKMQSGATWKRFAQGELNFRQIGHVLFGHFFKKKSKETSSSSNSPGKVSKATNTESRKTGDAPKTHLSNLSASTPVMMVYGSSDPDEEAAKAYFGNYAKTMKLPIHFERIEGANHNFSSEEWIEKAADLCERFFLFGTVGGIRK